MDEQNIASLKEQLEIYRENLRVLEIHKAKAGGKLSLEEHHQLKDTLAEIERLQAELDQAEAESARRERPEPEEVSAPPAKPPAPPVRPFPWRTAVIGGAVIVALAVMALIAKPWRWGAEPTPLPVVEVTATPTPSPPLASIPRTPVPAMNRSVVQATQAAVGAPEGMVYVPAGEFIMGSPEGEGEDDEHPQRVVYLDAFYMDRYEVTNEQFARFVDATGYSTAAEKAGVGLLWTGEYYEQVEGATWRHPQGQGSSIEDKMDHPVVQISWNDAAAYCRWAGQRLPTEAEWEKAARGTDGRIFPWGNSALSGNQANTCDVNCELAWKDVRMDDGYADTAPVGQYEAGVSPYGAYDMAGNVWEWVADWYDAGYYRQSPERSPQGPDAGEKRVLRGGSWWNAAASVRVADREDSLPNSGVNFLGARCAVSAPLPAQATATPVPPTLAPPTGVVSGTTAPLEQTLDQLTANMTGVMGGHFREDQWQWQGDALVQFYSAVGKLEIVTHPGSLLMWAKGIEDLEDIVYTVESRLISGDTELGFG
ncbi:MAG: SUMF1/EgtB/PvdO family nonheme iron enzyme, partial [Chloroflexi bacterium]|nr:SUMF1/EgtB/PvdO family nonheme iron enzyme [Chloroflexota bacterium]